MTFLHAFALRSAALVLLLSSIVVAVAAAPVRAQETPLYELIDLGPLIDEDLELPEGACVGFEGAITDMNDNRLAVGYYPRSNEMITPALYLGDTFVRLDGGDGGGQVRAVNNSGVMVGMTYAEARTDPCELPTQRQAAIWFGQDLDQLPAPEGSDESQANDVNESDAAVGWYVADSVVLPILWEGDAGTPLVMPEVREVPADEGQALAVAENGDAAGYARWREGGEVVRQTGVVWRGDEAIRLETLGNLIGNVATDINEAGDVIGYARTEQDRTVAVRWVGDQIEELPEVSLATESRALAMNEIGDIVGSVVTNSGQVAVIWIGDHALLLNSLMLPESGLTLLEANAINIKGEIAGVALDADGVRHGYVLVPVEAAG